jgi:hypothetical protein
MRHLALILGGLFLTQCGALVLTAPQAEKAVQTYVQQQVVRRGAQYRPKTFFTRAWSTTNWMQGYQVRHTYSITFEKGATLTENETFFVDATGVVRPD